MTTSPIDKLIHDTIEPGDIHKGSYVQAPATEEAQLENPERAGMVIEDLVSAGWTIVYDTLTYEPSTINNNAIPTQLAQKRTDGSPVFTTVYPGKPWRGTFNCFLHANSNERKMFDQMGFVVCTKNKMPNKYQADLHGKNRHRQEWEAWQQVVREHKEEEDRELQRSMIQAMGTAVTKQPTAVRSVRTPEQIESDRAKMAKVRSARKEETDGDSE